MGKNKLKTTHSNYHNGFVGTIPDEATYEGVKWGRMDWKPHVKDKMTAVTIPIEVFYRLIEMDKSVTVIPFEGEVWNNEKPE